MVYTYCIQIDGVQYRAVYEVKNNKGDYEWLVIDELFVNGSTHCEKASTSHDILTEISEEIQEQRETACGDDF